MPPRAHRGFRSWVFTHPNYNEGQLSSLREYARTEKVRFLIFGLEICPTTGTPHIQGYLYCGKPERPTWEAVKADLREVLGTDIGFLEPAHSSPQKNIEYCGKAAKLDPPGYVFKHGDEPKPGKRKDVDHLNELLKDIRDSPDGDTYDLLDETNAPIVSRHFKFLEGYRAKIQRTMRPANKDNFKVIHCVGPSGSGKSRYIADNYPGGDDCYWANYSTGREGRVFFDGYHTQRTIVLDDFKGTLPYGFFLRLCDRYPMELDIKCSGMRPAMHTTVVISSITPPEEWYDYSVANRSITEVKRRIHNTIQFPLNALTALIHQTSV